MGQVLWRQAPDRREDTTHTLSTCWVHKLPGLKRGLQTVSAKQDICHLSVEKCVQITWLWRFADIEGHPGQESWQRDTDSGGSCFSEGAKRDSDLQVLLLDYPGEEACGTQSR